MRRRRRRVREIPFSFDSFLDVVANVVGIIIRLILVVWVGARAYSSLKPAVPALVQHVNLKKNEPVPPELLQHRQELEKMQASLLDQLQKEQLMRGSAQNSQAQLATLILQQAKIRDEKTRFGKLTATNETANQQVVLSLKQLQQQIRMLRKKLETLVQLPRKTKALRYHTPVSRPVDAEEIMFECKNHRVTYIDLTAMLAEVRASLEDKAQQLRSQWQVKDVAGPAGAFRLRYVIERERSDLETVVGDTPPASRSAFRYGLSEWTLDPVREKRGETQSEALSRGSQFLRVIDSLDARQTVVTIWVYEDSFALYRRLRDFLYEKDIVVAGRPLPHGFAISSSKRGTRSRGQ